MRRGPAGAATDSAAARPPGPNEPRSSCDAAGHVGARAAYRARPPRAPRTGTGSEPGSPVRMAIARASASSSGIADRPDPVAERHSRSLRNGSITMSQTPTPTATLTIIVSMPLSESSAAVSWPSSAVARDQQDRGREVERVGDRRERLVRREVQRRPHHVRRGQTAERDGHQRPRQRPRRLVGGDAHQHRADPDRRGDHPDRLGARCPGAAGSRPAPRRQPARRARERDSTSNAEMRGRWQFIGTGARPC